MDSEIIDEVEKVDIFDGIQVMPREEAEKAGLYIEIGEDVDAPYIEEIKKHRIDPETLASCAGDLKIVYTPLHGSGNIPVRRVLREIGVENVFVVPEQELPNGNFPTVRVPNPEEKDAFDLAVAMQKTLGADLCVGTDPDCDRVGVACLTASGDVRLLTGNQIGCILLHYILSQKKALGTLPKNAAAVASATPCWPAPVSAMMRFLPIYLARRPSPMQWLSLCAPVWFRSSRFR